MFFANSEGLGVAVGSKILNIGIVAIICNQKKQDYLNPNSIHFRKMLLPLRVMNYD